ncbi:MAG: DNA adenine methylase [Syntrophobacter sp.]
MNYEGGKGGSGVYQQIINLMPVHDVYIETHLGGGNILLRKRPARSTIAIEIDPGSLKAFRESCNLASAVTFINGDYLEYLRGYRWTGRELVYSDPPYLLSTRRTQKPRYTFEYTEEDHRELLSTLLEVPAFVMISGYDSPLYNAMLPGWHTHTFTAATRRGLATEKLWMNFDPGKVLKHDYTYAGGNFRERERIKRKARRWVSNLAVLPEGERNFILQEISHTFTREFQHHSTGTAMRSREYSNDIDDVRRRSSDMAIRPATSPMAIMDPLSPDSTVAPGGKLLGPADMTIRAQTVKNSGAAGSLNPAAPVD